MEQSRKTYMPQSSIHQPGLFTNRYDRYNHSPKGMARSARYRKTIGYLRTRERFFDKLLTDEISYNRELYHKHQALGGSHARPRITYPGYRFLIGLVNATVVEVKS